MAYLTTLESYRKKVGVSKILSFCKISVVHPIFPNVSTTISHRNRGIFTVRTSARYSIKGKMKAIIKLCNKYIFNNLIELEFFRKISRILVMDLIVTNLFLPLLCNRKYYFQSSDTFCVTDCYFI